MLTSRDRILTTHVGSLPRNDKLTDLLIRREAGEAIDQTLLAAEMDQAVSDVVTKQKAAGIDIGNDGEQQRVGFQTYVPERMSGFAGISKRKVGRDFAETPELIEQFIRRFPRRGKISNAPQAQAEVKYHDIGQINDEIARFRRCAPKGTFVEDFATAPSPGIVATTLQNAFYDSHERYLDALARELRHEYMAIHDAGLMLQIDAPDLAMERTMMFQDLSDADFLKMCELHLHAINNAVEGIPRDRWRLHVCWGNWEGPHEHDVPLGSILSILYKTKAGALTIEFANPRHAHEYDAIRKGRLAEGHDPDPGRDRIDQQFRRASRSGGEADRGGRRRGRRPRTRHRLDRLRLRHLRRPRMGRELRWCGRSLNRCARAPISRPRGCGGSRARRNDYARLGCTAGPSTLRGAVMRTAITHATQKASRYDVIKITPLHPAIRGSIRTITPMKMAWITSATTV